MKKIFITLLLIFSIILIGCSSQISADTTITPETVTVTSIVEVENTDRIEKLEADNFKLEAELEKYKELISGLNDLLGNVYYGYASNNNWKSEGFTAFSLKYDDKYYLITAGHCVHYQYNDIDSGIFTDFKFKANFSDKWIYPKLLTYENEYKHRIDYAVFYSDKIDSGISPDMDNDTSLYKLNNISISNDIIESAKKENYQGKSGSPLIDNEGEVTGIAIVEYTELFTEIETVLKAIDNLK